MNQITETTIVIKAARAGGPTPTYAELMKQARARLGDFKLDEKFLEVIRAIDNGGAKPCSYEEVALQLGIPVGTVRSRASRARAVISKHLEQEAANAPVALRRA